jgi:2-phosphosulfolactate phosphatase
MVGVVFRREDVPREAVSSRACAVIDVLRAGTTVARAFAAGAREVRLFRGLDEARAARARLGAEALLAGERDGLRPEGFELGNSPLEFTPERVAGRIVLFTTTNGVSALADCEQAPFVAMASLVNAGAVARALARRKEDVLLVASGTRGRYSAEDVLCAGRLAERLLDEAAGPLALDDGALVALEFARANASRELDVLARSEHGRTLVSLGLGADLELCAEADSVAVVPVMARDPLRLVAAAHGGREAPLGSPGRAGDARGG